MRLSFRRRPSELTVLRNTLQQVRERSELLDNTCGIGLWEAVLHNADALHATLGSVKDVDEQMEEEGRQN